MNERLNSMPYLAYLQAFEKTLKETDTTFGHFEIIRAKDYDRADRFFAEHLLEDEPSCKPLGVGMNTTMRKMFMYFLTQDMSLMLLHPDTNEIIAIRVMGLGNDDPPPPESIDDEPMKTLVTLWNYCDERAKFFDHYKIKEAVIFFGIGVAKEYRNRGLATEIMKTTLSFLKNMNASPLYVKGGTASKYAANIFDKCGFKLLDELRYDEYIVDGQQVICNTGTHESLRSYGKVI